MTAIEQLGPYRIERVLGRGGMGTVYSGEHDETGQHAAIKVLSLALSDDGNFRDRFLAEIETLKKLKHPHIVQLFGDGEQDGYLFYVMELVEGRTLQEELQSGRRFEWLEVAEVAIDVCGALKHAHDRGIIHRDLKPANLLRTEEGVIKLSDFGIAKLFGATHLTADGSVVGTADYMAPEQAEGRPVTNRTDLYSLGNVMFTLLARRPPFTGPSLPQIIHKLRYDDAPLVRRYAPLVPAEMEQVIQQLLQKDPEERIPTALALANRLKAMQHAFSRGGESGPLTTADGKQPAEPPVADPDGATRIVDGERGAATEIQPTKVDSAVEAPGSKTPSWNEVTLQTSADDSEELTPEEASAPTVADPPAAPERRFTILDEVERQMDEEQEEHVTRAAPWQTLGLTAAVIVLISIVVYAAWPSSSGTLYEQITRVSSEEGPEAAKKQIEEFLRRFPDDARFEEVDDLRMDIECDWLQSRLALRELLSGGSQLESFEQDYLAAMRLKVKDAAGARAKFKQLVEQYGSDEAASDVQQSCLKAARHQLQRLGESP